MSKTLIFFLFPKIRCSLSGYILALEVENAQYRKGLEERFIPIFSALVDAILFRVQVWVYINLLKINVTGADQCC